jgi:hypothetical protein
VTTTEGGQGKPNPPKQPPKHLPSRSSADPSDFHTFPGTNNRVLTPVMIKLFQGFSPRGRVLSEPGDSIDPCTATIIYQAVPDRLFDTELFYITTSEHSHESLPKAL